MVDLIDVLLLSGAGLLGGILAGLLGIGGGIIFVSVFTTYLEYKFGTQIGEDLFVKIVIANSVFAILFAALSGSIKHYRSKNFYIKPVLLLGITGLLCAAGLAVVLSQFEILSQKGFKILFTSLMIPIILRMLLVKKKKSEFTGFTKKQNRFFPLVGGLSGFVTALSGLGGGFMVVPILNSVLKVPIKVTTSISLGMITVVSLGVSVVNLLPLQVIDNPLPYQQGYILFGMVLPVIGGVLIGSPLGVTLSKRLGDSTIKFSFVAFCCLVIIKLWSSMFF